jgi:hypothetical protein
VNRTLIGCAFIVVSAAEIPAGAARQHRDEDVSFQSGANTLAGTLSLPSGAGPFPAVVLLSRCEPSQSPTLELKWRKTGQSAGLGSDLRLRS